jgi:cellobiose phosphorylase
MTQPTLHFSEDGAECTLDDPRTARAVDNYLWNDSCFGIVNQTGIGCFDYQVGSSEAVQLLTGIGRTCDFDVFGRDHLMSRLVYLRDMDTGEFWNLNWEPACRPFDRYECRHGLGYTVITNVTNGIEGRFRIFLPPGDAPAELWTLSLSNPGSKVRRLSIFLYCQLQLAYKWGFDSYGTAIYREVHWNRELNAVVGSKHPFRRPHDYLTAFLTTDHAISGFDGSRSAFVGTYNTLAGPDAVARGRCSDTPGSAEDTILALQLDLVVPPGESGTIHAMLGATDQEANIRDLRDRLLSRTGEHFEQRLAEGRRLVEHNSVQTPDPVFDRMVNVWIKQGASFGAEWCRWGWNGYRDIVQHGLGVSALAPARTRAILLEALRHQYSSGLALRGWNPVDTKPYSDSALWLVFTLCAYLKETGDIPLLDARVPFYDGGGDTVLGHLQRALDFLEANKGAHGLPLIKFGDWNDSLTNIGREGRGESVWLAIAYAEAMREMAGLMHYLGRDAEASDCLARRQAVADAVNTHAWDGTHYLRCFDDEGRPVGSAQNRFAKIFMEPQCWALIAGIAPPERAARLIESCDQFLGTPLGYRLLAPAFTELDPAIGRISSMEPGIAENGTVYTHLNIWMILGLLRQGLADKACELFRKITPGYLAGPDDPKRLASFTYANCFFGPDHKNRPFQQEFTWVTGSFAWLNTVLINEMIGVQPDYNCLLLNPRIPSLWKECSIQRSWRNALYRIRIRRIDGTELQDGALTAGSRLPLPTPGAEHSVEVRLPVIE